MRHDVHDGNDGCPTVGEDKLLARLFKVHRVARFDLHGHPALREIRELLSASTPPPATSRDADDTDSSG